jgi:hypothetical protein
MYTLSFKIFHLEWFDCIMESLCSWGLKNPYSPYNPYRNHEPYNPFSTQVQVPFVGTK